MPLTVPRSSRRRLTFSKAASASIATAGATPAWRAAAMAASALNWLCTPSRSHCTSPAGLPLKVTVNRPSADCAPACQPPGTPKRSTGVHARRVMHEFRALVEERGVVFIGFDDEERRFPDARGNPEILRHAADQEAGLESRVLEYPGDHRSRRRFAVRAGDRQ